MRSSLRSAAVVVLALGIVAGTLAGQQPQRAPAREIVNVKGDIYRARNNNYFSLIYAVPVGPLPPRATCGKGAAIPLAPKPCQPAQVLADNSPNPGALFVQTGCSRKRPSIALTPSFLPSALVSTALTSSLGHRACKTQRPVKCF